MNLTRLDRHSIEIDLAFQGYSDENFLDIIDQDTRQILINPSIWIENFSKWLFLIRSDNNLECMEIIKNRRLFSLGLKFTDDQSIALLNKKWRKHNSSTDVLSFSAIEDNPIQFSNEFIELGDIIVSIPTANNQAKEYCHPLSRELQWLVAHGLLHLLGWDHPNKKALKEMLALQEELLKFTTNIEGHISRRKVNL